MAGASSATVTASAKGTATSSSPMDAEICSNKARRFSAGRILRWSRAASTTRSSQLGSLAGGGREVPGVDGELREVAGENLSAAALDPWQRHRCVEEAVVGPHVQCALRRLGPRCGPVGVGIGGLFDRDGVVAASEGGDAVDNADEVADQATNVHLGARGGVVELPGANGADGGADGGEGAVEKRPRVESEAWVGVGRHRAIVTFDTCHLVSGGRPRDGSDRCWSRGRWLPLVCED